MSAEPKDVKRAASIAIALLAGAAVVAGLMLAGGPFRARMERRDQARTEDLLAIAQRIDCLARNGAEISTQPVATDACPADARMTDPFNGMPYRVEKIDARNYRICAGFELPADIDRYPTRWNHREGDCLIRSLSQDDQVSSSPYPAD